MLNRIKLLRNTLSLSQTAFGERLGVSRDVITNIEQGRNKSPISDIFIHHICSTYNVNPDWLRTGEGDMFNPVDNTPLSSIKEQYNLSDKAATIIQNFLNLTKSEQDAFIEQAEKIFRSDD